MQKLELNKRYFGEMKKGGFGLERECIRVDRNGVLSHYPHPECFGNKLKKKRITTDFSESQIEMITPVFSDVDTMYSYADGLYDFVAASLEDEYLWCQSMPCIIDGDIPVAVYAGDKGREATEYREMLVDRYGGEKQLISGIHFNFSLDDGLLRQLYEDFGKSVSYRLFVDEVYLKLVRNYIRYGFLITYLCGCSNVCHKTFDKRCVDSLEQVDDNTFCTREGVSLRNSKWGYRNLDDLFPSYKSAKEYVDSVYGFISEGKISYAKEYYSSIRLKGSVPDIRCLKESGIQYVELRTIDINPFDKVGVDVRDLKFTHLFLLLMLALEENCYKDYQKDGQDAKELVSLYGLNRDISICGNKISASEVARELIEKVAELNKALGLYDSAVVDFQLAKLLGKDFAKENLNIDYIDGSLELMKKYMTQAKEGARILDDIQVADFLLE